MPTNRWNPVRGGTGRFGALGAVVIILLIAVAAAFAASPVKGATGTGNVLPGGGDPSGYTCSWVTDTVVNDYYTTGDIGIEVHLHCTDSQATLVGTYALQRWIPLNNGWANSDVWGITDHDGDQFIDPLVPCYTTTPAGSTWTYRAYNSVNVTFRDGYNTNYNQASASRAIPCLTFSG